MYGLLVGGHAVVDVYGKNTDVHSNTQSGIEAYNHAKVQIHLPSQHNTSHDNARVLSPYDNADQDRYQFSDGTITNVKWLSPQGTVQIFNPKKVFPNKCRWTCKAELQQQTNKYT